MRVPNKSPELNEMLGLLLRQLEETKPSAGLLGAEDDEAHVENFALKIFAKADRCATHAGTERPPPTPAGSRSLERVVDSTPPPSRANAHAPPLPPPTPCRHHPQARPRRQERREDGEDVLRLLRVPRDPPPVRERRRRRAAPRRSRRRPREQAEVRRVARGRAQRRRARGSNAAAAARNPERSGRVGNAGDGRVAVDGGVAAAALGVHPSLRASAAARGRAAAGSGRAPVGTLIGTLIGARIGALIGALIGGARGNLFSPRGGGAFASREPPARGLRRRHRRRARRGGAETRQVRGFGARVRGRAHGGGEPEARAASADGEGGAGVIRFSIWGGVERGGR